MVDGSSNEQTSPPVVITCRTNNRCNLQFGQRLGRTLQWSSNEAIYPDSLFSLEQTDSRYMSSDLFG